MLIVRPLQQRDYVETWHAMRQFTDARDENTPDEIWLVEHPPIYTLGQAGKSEHILNAGHIPVIQTDRGGQVTYHGPGQLMMYVLIDIKRLNMGVRKLVSILENSVIDLLKEFNVDAKSKCDAPGVYINDAKICSIGLRVRRGCSYHGLALNVDMDLSPFNGINPCGFQHLQMTQLKDFTHDFTFENISSQLVIFLQQNLA